MIVELISVGTELLLGNIVNTNAQYLSETCAKLGLNVYYQTTVGDNRERMTEVFRTALSRADLVIIGGGLGPTEDDITKDVCAELGLPEDTEQVELSVSATKVRTSQNRSWEATDEEMSRIWERLGAYFLRCESISRTNIRVFCGGGDSFSVVRGTTQPGFVEVDGRLMDYEDFETWLYQMAA